MKSHPDEVVMAMHDTAEHAVPMPNIPEIDVMWTVVGNLLTDVSNMSGKRCDGKCRGGAAGGVAVD
ncbi:MAG: hypothetical protein ACLUN0_07715 [Roseburia sp.]